jgi:3-keto-5-aminohexanoate cleavage enzyme
MKKKLVITATTANSWIYPDVKNWAETPEELIEDAVKCHEAGAAIIHVHLPRGEEVDVVKKIRERCDAVIQAGMSSDSIENRKGDFEARPDMLSIILNHHAEHFTQVQVNKIHDIEELENYCIKCKEYNIKPEWEVWHTGSYWNLEYLIKKGLIEPPHVVTCFFDWPGGTWSPATIDEYQHRVKYMPEGCIYTVSIMSEKQTLITALAIADGGNVRVGTEDFPFLTGGVNAKDNAEIVARIVRIAKEMGREVATSTEVRETLNLG